MFWLMTARALTAAHPVDADDSHVHRVAGRLESAAEDMAGHDHQRGAYAGSRRKEVASGNSIGFGRHSLVRFWHIRWGEVRGYRVIGL